MFLISMERSAILRSVGELASCDSRMGQDGGGRIPVTISTLSLEMSFTGCSPSEDMLMMCVVVVVCWMLSILVMLEVVESCGGVRWWK